MKTNKKVLAGIIIALAIIATNLQYAIDNYGIGNWGLGLEAIASGNEYTGTQLDHCKLWEKDLIECGIETHYYNGNPIEYMTYKMKCKENTDNSNCLAMDEFNCRIVNSDEGFD